MVPAQAANPLLQYFPLILIGIIFYFIVLLPEKKKKEAHNQNIAKLQKNDTVVTAGGIHATVVNIKEKTLIVRIDDNVKIEVDREAITTIHAKSKD